MNTKSKIQLTIEEDSIKSNFKHSLEKLIESYTIKGNVFAVDARRIPVEVSNGYFVEEKEYDNLTDCINEMNLSQAVSIQENKFKLGTIKKHLSECEEDKKVLDISYLQYVRE